MVADWSFDLNSKDDTLRVEAPLGYRASAISELVCSRDKRRAIERQSETEREIELRNCAPAKLV